MLPCNTPAPDDLTPCRYLVSARSGASGYPVINLGFSGHGLMHQEVPCGPAEPGKARRCHWTLPLLAACACLVCFQVATALAGIDAAVYVLDCEWNMDKYVKQVH